MSSFSLRWPFGGGGRRGGGEGGERSSEPQQSTDSNGADKGNKKKPNKGAEENERRLQEFGVTDRLCDFVKAFTVDTFKSFPLQAGGEDVAGASSNVRQDLTEWQESHAVLILSKVKEIAKLRYALCPRHLKEQEFWRIYFLLVKSYVAPYEMHAVQKVRLKMMEEQKTTSKGVIEVEMSETSIENDPSVQNSDKHQFDDENSV